MISEEMQKITFFVTNKAEADELINFLQENSVTWLSGRLVNGPSSDGSSIRDRIGNDHDALAFVEGTNNRNRIMWAYKTDTSISWQEFKQRFCVGLEQISLMDCLVQSI